MAERTAHLRPHDEGAAEVRPIELFYDLVYVLAVTQLTRHLLANLTLRGALETTILLLAVWGAWNQIIWITNYFDLDERRARLALIALMLASLIMSSSLLGAFDNHGLGFAGGLSASILGAQLFAIAGVGKGHQLTAVFMRAFAWWIPTCSLFVAGGIVTGDARIVVWLIALAVFYGGTALGFPVPFWGRNLTTDYTITGAHMAQRSYLFVTIALGESILVIGSQFGELPHHMSTVLALLITFAGSVGFWWIYFDRSADAAIDVIANSDDPGRLGVDAYTYFHLPIVAGIIVAAAGSEVAIAHPREQAHTATACLILGGPALFLAGQMLFKRAVWGPIPAVRLVPFVAFAALIPVAIVSTVLVLLAFATAVVVATAWWSTRTYELKKVARP
jgi:low temperature requirement protein LtrA